MFVPIELKPGVHYRSEERLANSAADIGTTLFFLSVLFSQ